MYLTWDLAIPVGGPGVLPFLNPFHFCQVEESCSCRQKVSIEKNLGKGYFLQRVVHFRTKPRPLCELNHICPFILTVQPLAAGKAVSNLLIATWSGG